jgi:hypothetical protein
MARSCLDLLTSANPSLFAKVESLELYILYSKVFPAGNFPFDAPTLIGIEVIDHLSWRDKMLKYIIEEEVKPLLK